MRFGRGIILFAALLAVLPARAQFFSSGEDPGSVRWRSISSGHFRIVYPAGNDSLALQYGLALERYRAAVGAGTGYAPNSQYRRPMPVILHSYTAQANGSVVWAPRRMDLFTRPEAVAPEPVDWITELAVHESRHVSQMQFARARGYGLFNLLTGELFTGAMSALYPGPALLEGDAVTAETALTRAGRGRSADFLEHYRVSFAEGDFRDWYRWRWDSQKRFIPDHYRAGYMLVAGAQYVYDSPAFLERYYSNVTSPWWPFPAFVLQRTLKQMSGKGLRRTWQEIAASQQALWAADEAARGPFGPVTQLSPSPRRFTEYLCPEAAGEEVYAIKQGITRIPQLVRLKPDGKTSAVRPFASGTGSLRYSESLGRLFWSEKVSDPRWTLKSDSRIFYIEPGKRKVRSLTRTGNLFNPSPSPDGTEVAVTEYPVRGGSAVRVLDGGDGGTLWSYPAPDSLQVVETAWLDGRLIASAVSPSGFGFYEVSDGYRPMTDPVFAKIKQLRSADGGVLFVSDLNGVNELHRLGADGSVVRLTNHRFGASDFLPSGDSLVFSALTPSGRLLYSEPSASTVFTTGATAGSPWPVADRLSAQEAPVALDATDGVFSSPKPYRKLPHLLRLHSWAPVYIDYDEVSSLSFETVTSMAGLGASLFLQNDLGTADAIMGYSASVSADEEGKKWNHSFHARFTYRGLYPVIELGTDIGGRAARQYVCRSLIQRDSRLLSLDGQDTDLPFYRVTARMYIPWNFSRAGWNRGIVPRIDASLSNDMVYTGEMYQRIIRMIGEKSGLFRVPAGAGAGRQVPLARVTAVLRGYAVQSRARSAIYPRWGIGAEGGVSLRPGASEMFAPSAFAYLYAYVPGIMDTHGARLSAMYQTRLDGTFPDSYTTVLPRGMGHVRNLQSHLASKFGSQTKFSFDYAMPLLPLDWSVLSPVAYLRNFELTLHADALMLSGRKSSDPSRPEWLYSAGADFVLRLGNLLWVPYGARIGVSWDFNGGSIVEELSTGDYAVPPHHLGFIFTVDLP